MLLLLLPRLPLHFPSVTRSGTSFVSLTKISITFAETFCSSAAEDAEEEEEAAADKAEEEQEEEAAAEDSIGDPKT